MTEPEKIPPGYWALNVNSLLIAIVMAISGWALMENISQGKNFTRLEERIQNQGTSLLEIRARLTDDETRMLAMQLLLTKEDERFLQEYKIHPDGH